MPVVELSDKNFDLVRPRIMCVDYGTKKIGVAVSDMSMKFASPVAIVNSEIEVFDLFEKYKCLTLVAGYPFADNDVEIDNSREYLICKAVDGFCTSFDNYFHKKYPIFLINEHFSSYDTRKGLREMSYKKSLKNNLDHNVAAKILSIFIDEIL